MGEFDAATATWHEGKNRSAPHPDGTGGEGREQKNCVATYAAGVATGKCFIYRVLYPSRATLCIRFQSDGNWGISQLEASCNRKADTATHEFVKQWLEPYRIGI